MKKPFKFRYVNEITGVFVLLALLILIAAIVVTGRAQGWFEPTIELRAEFPLEGTMGLRRGSEIRVLDTPAGFVRDIEPREDGVLEGIFQVRGRFEQYLRMDSTGIVRRAFGIAGDAFLDITRGFGDPIPIEHPYIPLIKDTELLDLAQSLLEEVRETTVPAIEQLQELLAESTELVRELRDPEREMQQMLVRMNRLTQDLEAGHGTLGQLLRDASLAEDLEALATEMQESVDELNRILANVAKATQLLPRMADRVAGELEDVPGLVYQTQATLQEAEVLLEGLQRHWLIRRYIDREIRPEADRLAPSVIIGAEGTR